MADLFKITIGTNVYVVPEPDSSPNNWLIIKEESYRPDKEKFILDKFKRDYSSIKVKSATQVYSLASRSAKLNEWLALANAEYAVIEGAPTFYRSYVDPDAFKSASDEVLRISRLNAEKAQQQALAASEYKAKLDEIEKDFKDKTQTSDSIAKIISLNTTSLPLTIQLAIDNYTPASSSSPNQRSYARECMINYKIKLLEALKKDPKLDIDKVIADNQTK